MPHLVAEFRALWLLRTAIWAGHCFVALVAMCAHGRWPLAQPGPAHGCQPEGSVTCLSRHLPLTWFCIGIICPFVLILPIEWKNTNPLWHVKVVILEERISSGVWSPPGHAFSHSVKLAELCAAGESQSGNAVHFSKALGISCACGASWLVVSLLVPICIKEQHSSKTLKNLCCHAFGSTAGQSGFKGVHARAG